MFITFEGLDGSGKSTQILLFKDYLLERHQRFSYIQEPGSTLVGSKIRSILHDQDIENMNPMAELLLYNAARAQLVNEVIVPCLNDRQIVFADRFYDSTLAYQGYGRQIDLGTVKSIIQAATGGLRPDLTFLLDIRPEESLKRRKLDQSISHNRMDLQPDEFYYRVYHGYQLLMAEHPERWVRINALDTEENIHKTIIAEFEKRLALRTGMAG